MSIDPEFEIPDAVSDEPQEVFAFVGLALYAASVLEAELINLAVGLRTDKKNEQIHQEEVDEWFSENEARTFGALANAIRRMTTLNSETEDLVSRALTARNKFVHAYFREHSEAFMSRTGRVQMIAKLRSDIALYRDADRALNRISKPLWQKQGATEEFMSTELAAMMARASARDDV